MLWFRLIDVFCRNYSETDDVKIKGETYSTRGRRSSGKRERAATSAAID